ncbi:protein phosphatase [Ruminococcus sp. YE71]|uniref:PP2C family protein-serine/threonine phosphatase n=1 Tax=unclassified Ruminococcus TaxID=2608920 RepID=UPI0008830F3C|nr:MULTISPECIES: protein phosphatase 2C domain-containing protein [unclassified Ruminococcus]SDA23097.1 protein phosphatase [Ruminococcus sp. YE78]SFW39281.1 protein phosphatase [Ruminococcus sp. YE71]
MLCEIRSFIGTRKYQEDSADFCSADGELFCTVCDGIGSRSGGELSSQTAVRRFVELYKSSDTSDFSAFILAAAEQIDREVYDLCGEGSGTTAVAVLVRGRELYWLSVGDSRLYILRGGELRQITTDHNYSYVLDLRREKDLIDEETYLAEQKKGGCLASFIGMGGIDIVDVNFEPLILEPNDRLLLATDGLYRPLPHETICGLLSQGTAREAADRLIDAVKSLDIERDNTTLAIIDLTEE